MSAPTGQVAPTRDLHDRAYTQEVMGVMIPVPRLEADKMSRSQRQEKLPPELRFPGTDRLSLGHGPGLGA